MNYLIRVAMLGLGLATITPVARGATLDNAQTGLQQMPAAGIDG